MNATSIEWCDFSVNPIRAELRDEQYPAIGHYCEKVSSGCANCYASRLQARFGMPPFHEQRVGRRDGRIEPFLDRAVLEKVLRRKKPARIFWCDMTDLFGTWVPDEWIASCFDVMKETPLHTHLVLTKRPERMRSVLERLRFDATGDGRTYVAETPTAGDYPLGPGVRGATGLRNVHLGVSVEDQATADERIPLLFRTPAALRFVSYEPALGPVDFGRFIGAADDDGRCVRCGLEFEGDGTHECPRGFGPVLDWIIAGGESGSGARPCDVAWIRSVIAQGKAAWVPVFVKQLGAAPWDRTRNAGYAPGVSMFEYNVRYELKDRKGGDPAEWPSDVRVRELPG